MTDRRRQHRISSLAAVALLAVFCLSGLVLNHRSLTESVDVPSWLLTPYYTHARWDRGLMRGTCGVGDSVVIYGASGMWRCDRHGAGIADFNAGLPANSSARHIISMEKRQDGTLLALAPGALYAMPRGGRVWRRMPLTADERFSDMTLAGDSVVVTGRSHVYVSARGASGPFRRIALGAPQEEGFGRPTLFRTVWMLHSGELFGLPGRLVVDGIALVFLLLAVTGLLMWMLRRRISRRRAGGLPPGADGRRYGRNLRLHRRVGVATIVLTVLVAFSGWLLRPPFLVALVNVRTAAVPGTVLDSDNPWHDKLRALRRDGRGGWILHTSEGFFFLDSLAGVPKRMEGAPPVSVMGLNVFRPGDGGEWIVGSFSGLYRWNPATGAAVDRFTGEKAPEGPQPPFGNKAVAGYSTHFGDSAVVVLYDSGTDAVPQPESLRRMPMSLWQYALEAHTGRLFFGNIATWFYVLLAGAVVLWSVFTGYRRR